MQTMVIMLGMALVFTAHPAGAQSGWIDLFNGTNLEGWEEHSGRAKYAASAGVLTSESVAGSGNSFLCTTQTFGNFELELEYRCDAQLNSGVQIRSEVYPQARTLNIGGKKIKVATDRVHGYQCEIDMDLTRGRMWTGGIYDEARRGWLFPTDGANSTQGKTFSEQGRKVSKPGEWNTLRIVADGPSIKTWLNGEPRASIADSVTLVGVVGLQVHGIGKDTNRAGLKSSFRNIRIRKLKPDYATGDINTLTAREKSEGWRLLWDGKTTEGWRSAKSTTLPAQCWAIRDGELSVLAGNDGGSVGGDDIITKERFSKFELTADFKITPGANSGIKYFVQPPLEPLTGSGAEAATGSAIGLEYQILDDVRHPDAKKGRDGNRTMASLYDLFAASPSKKSNPIGEWNTARIVASSQHVEHWLNGAKVLQYERGFEAFHQAVAGSKYRNIPGFGEWVDGHILLQDHGNRVCYRNIKIRVLAR